MNIQKKAFSLITAIRICFSLGSGAFAATAAGQVQVTPDTVVTKDNIHDVLDYIGIAQSNFKEDKSVVNSKTTTVRDIQNAIIELKNTPRKQACVYK